MSDDPTLPPHKPNTLKVWLPRIWSAMCGFVSAHADWAILLFAALLALAVIL